MVSAENSRALSDPDAHCQIARNPTRFRIERRDGASERINDAPLAFVHDRRGQAVPSLATAVIDNLFDEIVYSHDPLGGDGGGVIEDRGLLVK
jgi:hypothetical protein